MGIYRTEQDEGSLKRDILIIACVLLFFAHPLLFPLIAFCLAVIYKMAANTIEWIWPIIPWAARVPGRLWRWFVHIIGEDYDDSFYG